jgi:hypothetical protein
VQYVVGKRLMLDDGQSRAVLAEDATLRFSDMLTQTIARLTSNSAAKPLR